MLTITVTVPPASELPLGGGKPEDPENFSEVLTTTQWEIIEPGEAWDQVTIMATYWGSEIGETVISVIP